jgi:hypothetical protein
MREPEPLPGHGGSVGSRAVDGGRNFFNVITAHPGNLRLELYSSANTRPFERVQSWRAAINLVNGSLTLDDWEIDNQRDQ